MKDTEIYKLQIARLIKMLEGSTAQYGLKRALFEVFGTVNHRIRKYYERRRYVARLTGGYVSTSELKTVVDKKDTSLGVLLGAIAASDRANRPNKVYLRMLLKRTWLTVGFAAYLFMFWIGKTILKAIKRTLKR